MLLCMEIYQPTLDTSKFGLNVTVILKNFLVAYIQISLPIFHINFTFFSSHHSQLSSPATFSLMSSISLSTLQLCFNIVTLISRVTHELGIIFGTKIFNTTPISKCTHSCHVKCQHAICTHEHQGILGQK
jgi:hypothetical protein